MSEREAGGLSWAETVAMRNELRLERERADKAEAAWHRAEYALAAVQTDLARALEVLELARPSVEALVTVDEPDDDDVAVLDAIDEALAQPPEGST